LFCRDDEGDMAADWILLRNIPEAGKRFVLEDQNIWLDPVREFNLLCALVTPLRAEFTVYVQEEGVLIRGRVSGRVAMPCNRCTEDALVEIDQKVDTYELFPDPEGGDDNVLDVDKEVLRPAPNGQGVEMNLPALAWEEFFLALPMKPLCHPACKGLCTGCGVNLNTSPCVCKKENLDPRLAPLRNLKIGR
jgi:uncharacterized protein